MAWGNIISLIIKALFTAFGAIGVARAFTGQPIVYAHELQAVAGGSKGGASASPAPGVLPSEPPAILEAKAKKENWIQYVTNPWFYGALAVAAIGGATFIRQTRGLGRDIGSGVRSTREAVKTDLRELNSDPD